MKFYLYTYQLLQVPADQDLFPNSIDAEEFARTKNSLFDEALDEVLARGTFFSNAREVRIRQVERVGQMRLLTLAPHLRAPLTDVEGQEVAVDNWPPVRVVILNDPTTYPHQVIAVQDWAEVFKKPDLVPKLLGRELEAPLRRRLVAAFFEPKWDPSSFWAVADQYKGKVTKVSFRLVTPNMADISGALSKDLKDLQKKTAAGTSELTLKGVGGGPLTLNRDNKNLEGLVEYSAEGGGGVSLKVGKLSIPLSENKKKRRTVAVEGLKLTTATPEDLKAAVEAIIKVWKQSSSPS